MKLNQTIKPVSGGRRLLLVITQALLILAISAGISQMVLFPLLEDIALQSVQRWEVEYMSSGTIDLATEQLNALPIDMRAVQLTEMSKLFGFGISLKSLKDVILDKKTKALLVKNGTAGDPKTYSAYKLLDGGSQVLIFDRMKVSAQHLPTEAQRTHMGSVAMLEGLLLQKTQSEWPSLINSIEPLFGYPISLKELSELDLSAEQKVKLEENEILTLETEESREADYPAEMAYKKVGNRILVLGPFSPPVLKRFYPILFVYYIVLAIIILLPLILWLIPTWRSMNQLSIDTALFGQGVFTIRATPIRGSKINYLINVFNQMAEKNTEFG
ncbi:MAG: hypothetical protein ABW170_10935 [Candidatus Thiodiazotropha sp. L084R]